MIFIETAQYLMNEGRVIACMIHDELIKLNITYDNISVLLDKDGVTVARITGSEKHYIVRFLNWNLLDEPFVTSIPRSLFWIIM